MDNQNYLFKNVSMYKLAQEEYVFLKKNDYALAPNVSDCMVVFVSFKEENGKLNRLVGHFSTKDFIEPSASYLGFRSIIENIENEVVEIKYATNYVYKDKVLRLAAEHLSKGTCIDPQEVQSFLVPQDSILPYRPILYYSLSGSFRTAGSSEQATNPNLETNLISIPYPHKHSTCTIL